MDKEIVEKQAKYLAADNRVSEPEVEAIYWFPNDGEVRLVEILPSMPVVLDGKLRPFYFRPAPSDGLPAPTGIAMIRPEEFGKLELPEGWGGWADAVKIEAEGQE